MERNGLNMKKWFWMSFVAGSSLVFFGFTIDPSPGTVDSYELARGARLYDSWYGEKAVDAPTTRHPAYPGTGAYANKAASTWRCKECHGWDYLGANGAYANGSHFTGIKGTFGASAMTAEQLTAVLSDKNHGYDAVLDTTDFKDLTLFLQQGQLNMNKVIDRETRAAKGVADSGAGLYQNLCSTCHGLTGREKEDMPNMGILSRKNPWETLHKVLYGHPGSDMPAYQDIGRQKALDIIAYMQTLPE
jgi:thiosulfate dehydrogenase